MSLPMAPCPLWAGGDWHPSRRGRPRGRPLLRGRPPKSGWPTRGCPGPAGRLATHNHRCADDQLIPQGVDHGIPHPVLGVMVR